jgi:hypothetical protein
MNDDDYAQLIRQQQQQEQNYHAQQQFAKQLQDDQDRFRRDSHDAQEQQRHFNTLNQNRMQANEQHLNHPDQSLFQSKPMQWDSTQSLPWSQPYDTSSSSTESAPIDLTRYSPKQPEPQPGSNPIDLTLYSPKTESAQPASNPIDLTRYAPKIEDAQPASRPIDLTFYSPTREQAAVPVSQPEQTTNWQSRLTKLLSKLGISDKSTK